MNITITNRVAHNIRKVASGSGTPSEKGRMYASQHAHAIAHHSPRAVFEALENGTLKITEVADRGRVSHKKVAKKPALAAPKAKKGKATTAFSNAQSKEFVIHPSLVALQQRIAKDDPTSVFTISAMGIQYSKMMEA